MIFFNGHGLSTLVTASTDLVTNERGALARAVFVRDFIVLFFVARAAHD